MTQEQRSAGITVAVVEDHVAYRSAVVAAIAAGDGITVLAACGSVEELHRRLPALDVDVVVLDLRLPGVQGAEGVATVVGRGPAVLVLSAQSDPRDVAEVVRAGATGYLLKAAPPDRIVDAVRAVARGQAVLPPGPTPHPVPDGPQASGTSRAVPRRSPAAGPFGTLRRRRGGRGG